MRSKLLFLIPLVIVFVAGPTAGQDKKDPFEKFKQLPKEAKAVLEQAEQLELYSLDPTDGMLPKEKEKDGFHGWKVLGKTQIKEAETLKKVRAALDKGIAESEGVAACFRPRHGIRA